jgi:amino-acid N-acetyltransferase
MSDSPSFPIDLIRDAFRYQSRFSGQVMVFKVEYPVIQSSIFPSLVKDMALISQTGIRVVLVPGAKEWIDRVLSEHGIRSEYTGAVRITPESAMPYVEMAAYHVATRCMGALAAGKVDGVIGHFVRARGMGVIDGVDMEHTGTVDRIHAISIGKALDMGMVPILPCIGLSPSGKPYNVQSSGIALSAAAALGASKLFVISAHPGLRVGSCVIPPRIETDEGGAIPRLTPEEAEALLAANGSADSLAAMEDLNLALQAIRLGVERSHLIDGRLEGAILQELFSNRGAGTMIYADEYHSIRGLKNTDIPDVLRLMEPLMQQGVLIRRTAEDIQQKKEDYAVYEIDGSILACGALHHWGDQGEIAALATDPAYADLGLGRRMVSFLIDRAGKEGLRRVFILTTQTQDWFQALGFTEAAMETLPKEKLLHLDRRRNSRLFSLPPP